MHSKKASIIIGLIIFAANLILAAVYLQKQGEHTFGFIKSLYEEIKVYREEHDKQAAPSTVTGNTGKGHFSFELG
jgi:hypothetical protein